MTTERRPTPGGWAARPRFRPFAHLTRNGQPVTSIAQAKARAQGFADRLDLRVG
ncbi:hypothetical protein [Streptomyces osmaniensis]|uniref:hypothetical protein n=1 Tax=Streptomyces osmaniensis TaxID=593134 RepID=UPI001C32F339|nr:hypothetical protein KJK32_43150 [Streptomyces sp. JCM17656]